MWLEVCGVVRAKLLLLRWVIRVRERIEALWASHRGGMWLCFIGYIAAAALLWWIPSPGIGVAVMGIAAALMTARKEPSAWEKAAWTDTVAWPHHDSKAIS